jgi:hypothetical protein
VNLLRILLAALGGFVAYFILGGLFFAGLPWLRNEFMKFPAVYRTQESMKPVMPFGMLAMFVAMIVLSVLFAMTCRNGSGIVQGATLGALIGIFCVCSFVIHNYVNLNIGLKLTVEQAAAYFIEWVVTGMVIGLIYRPLR